MKKLLSLILALVMVLALSVTAMASAEPAGEASGETSVEVTNEGFGSYVSYLRKYIAECDDPQFDDGAKDMALADLDAVEIGADVHAFPFDMFVEIWGAMSYEEFMTSQAEGSAEPETQEAFDAYVAYVRDYMENYNGEGTKEGFDEASKAMALAELDNVAFGSSVNGFPFVMYVNEFGVLSYADFIAASGEPAAVPQTQEEFDAYREYLREYIRTVDLASVNPDFVEDARDMCISELDGTGFGSDVYAFPFEMIVNELKAMTYDEFVKAGAGAASGYDGYVAYLDAYIRANVEADYVEMALGDLYAATEAQAVAEEFPFEMFTGAHGAMSYAQWQAANA